MLGSDSDTPVGSGGPSQKFYREGANHIGTLTYLKCTSSITQMGKAQKKTGKGRLDKYYKLAKYVPTTFRPMAN